VSRIDILGANGSASQPSKRRLAARSTAAPCVDFSVAPTCLSPHEVGL
jgi:hypothetical protein